MLKKDLIMTRGNTFKKEIKLTTKNNVEIDLENSNLTKAYFSVKSNVNNTDVVLQKKLDDGISISDNLLKVKIDPDETDSLSLGEYYYDVNITLNGDVYTPIKGKFIIDWNVTGKENKS